MPIHQETAFSLGKNITYCYIMAYTRVNFLAILEYCICCPGMSKNFYTLTTLGPPKQEMLQKWKWSFYTIFELKLNMRLNPSVRLIAIGRIRAAQRITGFDP